MKLSLPVLFLFCFSFLFCACTQGQKLESYQGKGGPVKNDGTFTEFELAVPKDQKLSGQFGLKEITVDLEHPDNSEILMFLVSPDGHKVELTYLNTGKNFSNTCFADDADKPIKCAAAPFTGRFRPVDYLGTLNNGQSSKGKWKLLVKDWKPSEHSGNLRSWTLSFGTNAAEPVKLQETKLPIIVINTKGADIPDSPRITASMGIIAKQINTLKDPYNDFNGVVSIETRGSSSQNYSKKSFLFSTVDQSNKKIDKKLLGLPAEKDWILYAPYSDKSLIRNYLSYELYRSMGHYAPRTKFVELVINGEYQGVYVLTEKIKRDENRVKIAKQEPKEIHDNHISGGYIFKIDRVHDVSQGWYSSIPAAFGSNKKIFYNYYYPHDSDLSVKQKNYIRSFMDGFETTLISQDGTEKALTYIDEKCFIDFFLINEFSKNVDSYKLSTFLYKDRDSIDKRLHIGPIWDYDLAWKNANYGTGNSVEGWQYQSVDTVFPIPLWWEKLMQDRTFRLAVKQRWQELRKTTLSTNAINSLIDNTTRELSTSVDRNFKKWPLLGSQVGMNPEPLPKDYSGEIEQLKNWVKERGAWMDEQIAQLK
jgi:subtilisin-like proprotein convertase family protein